MDIGMFSNDVKVPNKEKYYFVDNFDEFFLINNQTEFQDKIYRNSVNIQNNLEVFKKLLIEISELDQKDTTMLVHCLKFVDMLNLFMNKNILNKVFELIKEINDQIAVLTNLESKDDILKCIKYTEKSLIYYKKKHFKLLFFKDNETIYKEFEELFSNSSEARNFKQLQNCFYIFARKLAEEKRNNIQNKINQIKEKKSKSQNSINFYYNNNSNFAYNNYYSNYSSYYTNNYSYNNYYSKQRFFNQDESTNSKDKSENKTEEASPNPPESNNIDIVSQSPSPAKSVNKEESLELIEIKSPNKNNAINKDNDNFNNNIYFKQHNGYFKKYYNNNYSSYSNNYINRNYYNYNNNYNSNNFYNHEKREDRSDKEAQKSYENNYKTHKISENPSNIVDSNIHLKTYDLSNVNEENKKIEGFNNDTSQKNEETNEPSFNKHQIEIIPANINYVKSYSNREKSDPIINDSKYHHYSNSYSNNNNFYNNQNNMRNKYYNYNNKLNNQNNYHSISNNNIEHSYSSKHMHHHNYHSTSNDHNYNKMNNPNNYQNNANINYKHINHSQFNKYLQNSKNNQENTYNQAPKSKDSESNLNHNNVRTKQNLKKKDKQSVLHTLHKFSEENIPNNIVFSTSPKLDTIEPKQNSFENINLEQKFQPFNFAENNNHVLHLSANQIFELDKNEKTLAKNDEETEKNEKYEMDDNEPEDFLNDSINSQNLDQMEQKINEYLKNNPDINNAIKNGPSEEDEVEDNVSSSSQEQEEGDGNRSSNTLPKNNKIIFADDNNDIQINNIPQNIKIYENHNENKFTNDDVNDLITKIINNDKNYETTEKIKINLDSEVFQSKRFKENNKANNDFNTDDANNYFYQENQMMSSPYNFNAQNHDLSNYHDYFMSNYAHFFFRGRDSSIHREYFALKCLEQQKPFLITTHLKDFEDKILIPLYQRINISMHKKKKMYYYTYTKYRNIIYKVLYNDKVLSKVEPYGSYVNNFLIDSGDIDICIVPKCSFIEFNIYLERIKDFIIEKV